MSLAHPPPQFGYNRKALHERNLMTPAAIPQAFRETNRIFEEEVVGKGDFAALAHVYTSDATILPPGAGRKDGRIAGVNMRKGRKIALTDNLLFEYPIGLAKSLRNSCGRHEVPFVQGFPIVPELRRGVR